MLVDTLTRRELGRPTVVGLARMIWSPVEINDKQLEVAGL